MLFEMFNAVSRHNFILNKNLLISVKKCYMPLGTQTVQLTILAFDFCLQLPVHIELLDRCFSQNLDIIYIVLTILLLIIFITNLIN